MSWRKVSIGEFLNVRTEKYKPIEANNLGLKRVDKIDFSGKYHLSDKLTNTDMILVKPGDLLISGINAEKGAVTVYDGIEDAIATIHYSSYQFDEEQIDIEYFRWFLKSDAFKKLLKLTAGNGIKTELKPKHILPLEITLPDLTLQREIVRNIVLKNNKVSSVHNDINTQLSHIHLLRQTILQESVQGKLVPQNPKDEPASELLKKIQAEKEQLIKQGKLKKSKPLPPISEDEIPYDLPKGWEWCRLGTIITVQNGYAFKSQHYNQDGIKLLRNINIGHGELNWSEKACYPESLSENLSQYYLNTNDIVISLDRPIISTGLKIAKVKSTDIPCLLLQRVGRINSALLSALYLDYLFNWLNSKMFIDYISPGRSSGVPHISTTEIENLIFALPPFQEQQRIVTKVEQLMGLCDELEQQVQQSKTDAEKLLQAVLREAFEGKTSPASGTPFKGGIVYPTDVPHTIAAEPE